MTDSFNQLAFSLRQQQRDEQGVLSVLTTFLGVTARERLKLRVQLAKTSHAGKARYYLFPTSLTKGKLYDSNEKLFRVFGTAVRDLVRGWQAQLNLVMDDPVYADEVSQRRLQDLFYMAQWVHAGNGTLDDAVLWTKEVNETYGFDRRDWFVYLAQNLRRRMTQRKHQIRLLSRALADQA